MDSAEASLKAAAGLLWVNGVGFGWFCIPAVRSLLAGRGVPIVFGFPAYGGGPFERVGIRSTVPLLLGFLLVCVLEIVAGCLVWNGRAAGAWLALALVVPGLVFWVGFALPIPPIFALVRTGLIVANLRAFS
jgi:hypothetical protein